MKSIMQTVAIIFASAVLFTSCAHKNHSHDHGSAGCKCGSSMADCKCEKKSDAAKSGQKEECEHCKKGS